MRIAQIAPLYESVPPKGYGGTERVVSYLTEELVRQGHDVTLFASGDSLTQAKLVPICDSSLRLDKQCIDQLAHHVLLIERVFQQCSEFDIVHSHIDYLPFSLLRRHPELANITTLHGRLDIADLIPTYREYSDMPVISISNAQRTPLSWINWQSTIYHGLPVNLYEYNEKPDKYLAFLGRITPEKCVDMAIQIAIDANMPLKIAAKVDKVDQEYFDTLIKPLLNHSLIEYIGEISDAEKNTFLGNASALIFPIDWPEPFGLVMIEAMACGTPVIARRRGSVPEVIDHGVTGFIVDEIEGGVKAVAQVSTLSRKRCRQVFEERFSVTRMATDYVKIYTSLLAEKQALSLINILSKQENIKVPVYDSQKIPVYGGETSPIINLDSPRVSLNQDD